MRYILKKAVIPILIGLTILFSTLGRGADIYWIDGDGIFSNTTKWIGGVPPGALDRAVFTNLGGAATASIVSSPTNMALLVDNPNPVTLSIAPGTSYFLTNDYSPGTIVVGTNQTSALTITGGGYLQGEDLSGNIGNYYFMAGFNAPGSLTLSNISFRLKKLVCGSGVGNSSILVSNSSGFSPRLFRALHVGSTTANASNNLARILASKLTLEDIVIGDIAPGGDNNGLIIGDGTKLTNTTMSVGMNGNVQSPVGTNAYCIVRGAGTAITNKTAINFAGVSISSGSAVRPTYYNRFIISNSASVTTPSLSFGDVNVGAGFGAASYNNTFLVDGAALDARDGIVIGWGTSAFAVATNNAFIVTNGASVATSNLVIGRGSNITLQSVAVNGGTLMAKNIKVGESGGLTNFMTMSSGSAYSTNLFIGTNQTSPQGCSVTVAGSATLYVTNNGNAKTDIANGYISINGGTAHFENLISTNNQYGITNSQIEVIGGGTMYVRNFTRMASSNRFFYTVGTVYMTGTNIWDTVFGGNSGPQSSVVPSAFYAYGPGIWTNNTSFRSIGGALVAHLVISNGMDAYSPAIMQIGVSGPSILTVADSGTKLYTSNASYIGVGAAAGNGNGSLALVRNGALAIFNNAIIGYNEASNCEIRVTDPGSTLVATNQISMGYRGSNNRLFVTNGATLISSKILCGNIDTNLSFQNKLRIFGSTLTNTEFITVGEGGWGNTFSVSGGARVHNTPQGALSIGPTINNSQGDGTNTFAIAGGSIVTNFGTISVTNSKANFITMTDRAQLYGSIFRMSQSAPDNLMTMSGNSLATFSSAASIGTNNILRITGNSVFKCNGLQLR